MLLEKQLKESPPTPVPRDGYNPPLPEKANLNGFDHRSNDSTDTCYFAKASHVNLLWIPVMT